MRYANHNWDLPPVSPTHKNVYSEYALVALLMDIRDELQAIRELVASTRADTNGHDANVNGAKP